jgi:hypothetical protein
MPSSILESGTLSPNPWDLTLFAGVDKNPSKSHHLNQMANLSLLERHRPSATGPAPAKTSATLAGTSSLSATCYPRGLMDRLMDRLFP